MFSMVVYGICRHEQVSEAEIEEAKGATHQCIASIYSCVYVLRCLALYHIINNDSVIGAEE